MALVGFYKQFSLSGARPHDANLFSGLLVDATRLVEDGDPTDDLEDHSVFVDIEDFMKSVLHVPADWRAQWGPVIRLVKRDPDFMKHYLEYRVLHGKKHPQPEESHYESLLLMNNATLRVAFPAIFSQDVTSAPLPLMQLVHIVDDGSSDYVLNDGNSIPQLVTESKVTRIPHVCS